MVGIYKITNKINNHCYIGQSTQIEIRQKDHKIAAFNQNQDTYEYPLYRAIRKYGIENFEFEVIEICNNEELNDKEVYWINYYSPEYNQTIGGDYQVIPQKLTYEQVQEIQQLLVNDPEGKLSHVELAKKYNVHKDTIRDINVGRTWHNNKLNYPLHYSKFDINNPNKKKILYCSKCGKEIQKNSISGLCLECFNNRKKEEAKNNLPPISREELKAKIRILPFTTIAPQYGVTDNAIRKWCDKYNLPRKKTEIKKYTDEEWKNI